MNEREHRPAEDGNGPEAKRRYEAPRILASYDKEDLEAAMQLEAQSGGGCGCGCGGGSCSCGILI